MQSLVPFSGVAEFRPTSILARAKLGRARAHPGTGTSNARPCPGNYIHNFNNLGPVVQKAISLIQD